MRACSERFLLRRPLVWSALALAISLGATAVRAKPPANPDPDDKTRFDQILQRLKDNKASMPTNVDDAIKSLTMTVTKSFNCPKGSAVTMVTINITSMHVKFDPNLTAPHVPKLPAGKNGYLVWQVPPPAIKDGKKTYTAKTFIMLDPSVVKQSEQGVLIDMLGGEGLLYHELLHAELLIDAMESDDAWKKKACDCTFDLGPTDKDDPHKVIPGKLEGYWSNRTGNLPKISTVEPPKQTAKANGSFSIPVANLADFTGKACCSFEYFTPENANIKKATLTESVNSKNQIVISGMLADPTKRGFFMVQIDPPVDVLYVGLEDNVEILPAVQVIPTTGSVGLVLLILGLVAAGAWALYRARY